MQQIGFSIQVSFIPKEDDPVRLLFEITEGLDYTNLYKTYSTLGRNPVVDPVTLFRILIYGDMNKIYSSRLKQDYVFKRFLFRGKKNVLIEFTLLAFAYNIQKLFNKAIKNINGILLHIPKIA